MMKIKMMNNKITLKLIIKKIKKCSLMISKLKNKNK